MLTTDRNDPDLGKGEDKEKVPQSKKYLILSEEERAKGFIRPVRDSYIHRGREVNIKAELHILTEVEKHKYRNENYAAFLKYPKDQYPLIGTYLTQRELETYRAGYVGGCGALTKMGKAIAETYARDPKFYGFTYCTGCSKHLNVNEFIWDGTNEEVGS